MNYEKNSYDVLHKKMTALLHGYPAFARILPVFNRALTLVVYVAYLLLVVWLMVQRDTRIFAAIGVPAVSFALLSVIRKKINRPRPYETWQIEQLLKKDKAGHSMPSRHVFSAAVIAMVILSVNTWLGILFLAIAAIIAVVRVVGGVHYPSDVIVGYIAGIAAGFCLFLF